MPVMLRHFLLAIEFLTRLPVPRRLATTEEELGQAAAFFPLVGIIVGGSAAAVFVLGKRVMPVSVAVLLSLGFAAFITSAFMKTVWLILSTVLVADGPRSRTRDHAR